MDKGINVQMFTSGLRSEELVKALRVCSTYKMPSKLNPETFFITIDNKELLFTIKHGIDFSAIWLDCESLVQAFTFSFRRGDGLF